MRLMCVPFKRAGPTKTKQTAKHFSRSATNRIFKLWNDHAKRCSGRRHNLVARSMVDTARWKLYAALNI